ncbi:LanC-like protein 3 [Irineochytrium annulatum]|nr:LanC-like protein 3 [Irineochytrium annulatum]
MAEQESPLPRHIPNPFLSLPPVPRDSPILSPDTRDLLLTNIRSTVALIVKNSPPSARCKSSFESVYAGHAGTAWMLWRLHEEGLLEGSVGQGVEGLKLAREFAEKARAVVPEEVDVQRFGMHTSGLFSNSGATMIAALIARAQGDTEAARNLFDEVLTIGERCVEDTFDELCWGRSGYLAAGYPVFERMSLEQDKSAEVPNLIDRIGEAIIRDCGPTAPLSTTVFGRVFLGPAHGISGVLVPLMRHRQLATAHATAIHSTLSHLLTLRDPATKNWPMLHPAREDDNDLLHWCHGAPGMCIVYAVAALTYPEHPSRTAYIQAAQEAGELTWERGLLRKGVGLCHGVTGNGYAFLFLHAVTREGVWMERAVKFAEFACAWEKMVDDGTMQKADRLWSLFEGVGGAVVYWADVMRVAQGKAMVGFPCFYEGGA